MPRVLTGSRGSSRPGLGQRAIVRVQGPVPLSRESEPQPDLALLRPGPDFYVDLADPDRNPGWLRPCLVRSLRPAS